MNSSFSNSTQNVMNSGLMTATVVCVVSVQAFNFFVGLPLNIYIIRLLVSKNGGVDVCVVFALNHVVSEILFCLVAPLYTVCIISLEICVGPLLGFWLGITLPARYLFPCWVSVERYVAVIHPVTFLRFKPLRYRVACSSVAWICALSLGIASMVTFPGMPYNAFGALYLFIFLLDSFCCIGILKGLLRPGPGDREGNREEMNTAKKKAFKVVSLNLVIFLIQIIPVALSFGLLGLIPRDEFKLAVAIGLDINILGGFIHPFFVLHRAGKLTFIKCCK
ncbi:G-protein coupled receptor 4-like [Hoplias malabaricus]|uniref:G-protein coupled receptor 4-like n=1 Tax=Hoplias malabaricus TaxID=27720 RepID=UPI003463062F